MKIFLIILTLYGLSACAKESDEAVIRAIVDKAVSSAREKDIKGVMGHISKDYKDDAGNDYNGVKGILFYHFMRPEKISIFVRDVDVEVKGETALVKSRLILIRGKDIKSLSAIAPQDAAAYEFSIIFRKEDNRWKALAARWESISAIGLI